MHLRQKLTFMAFGSILTLAGYLLATIASDITTQPEPEINFTLDGSSLLNEINALGKDKMTDRLMAMRTFIICPRKEEFKVFDAVGKLVEEKKATRGPDKDGEMSYTITSPTTAIFYGNIGQAEVEFIRADRSITFIETTPLGGKHTMVISDEWDDKEKGFKFIYTRHVNNILANETMKTTITGIAIDLERHGWNQMKR